MKILHIISRLTYGGAASLVAQWVSQLSRLGHDVEVCTIYTAGQFANMIESQGLLVHNFNFDPDARYKPSHKYDPRIVIKLAKLIMKGHYDIVHVHLFPTSLFVASVSLLTRGTAYITSEHNVYNRRRKSAVFKLLDSLIYQRYQAVIAVSDEVRKALVNWLPHLGEKVVVVPNAIELERFNFSKSQIIDARLSLGISKEDIVALFAGRLATAKGLDVLLNALPHVSKPNFKLLIAGSGPFEDEAKKQASNLVDNVIFVGLRDDIPLLLNVADMLILPSRWEGLPMILLEAMAARCPIITTPVGGIPEVITHNQTGWLVSPEDTRELAEGIETLACNSRLRSRLSHEAFNVVQKKFSVTTMVNKLTNVYYQTVQ